MITPLIKYTLYLIYLINDNTYPILIITSVVNRIFTAGYWKHSPRYQVQITENLFVLHVGRHVDFDQMIYEKIPQFVFVQRTRHFHQPVFVKLYRLSEEHELKSYLISSSSTLYELSVRGYLYLYDVYI